MARKLVTFLFCVTIAWAFLVYGATEVWDLYRLFLVLSAIAVIAAWLLPVGKLLRWRYVPLGLIGAFLLVQIAVKPTVEAYGYVQLGVGWLAFVITLLISCSESGWPHSRSGNHDLESLKALYFFLIGLGAVEAFYGLAQVLAGFDFTRSVYYINGGAATGTLINRNHFAGLLNMTMPLALGALFAHWSGRCSRERLVSELYARTWIIVLATALMALAVFLSLSRGGVVTFLILMVFAALLIFWDNRRRAIRTESGRRRRSMPSSVVVLILLTALSLATWVGIDTLLGRFWSIDPESDFRTSVYSDTVKLIKDNPLLGVGPGFYQWRFRPYQSESQRLLVEYAHSDYLQTAAEWGIPRAALFWLYVLWVLSRSVVSLLSSSSSWKKAIHLGLLLSLISIVTQNLADGLIQIPENLSLIGLILCASSCGTWE